MSKGESTFVKTSVVYNAEFRQVGASGRYEKTHCSLYLWKRLAGGIPFQSRNSLPALWLLIAM